MRTGRFLRERASLAKLLMALALLGMPSLAGPYASLPSPALAAGGISFERVTAVLRTGKGRFELPLELARTARQRARGLMRRKRLHDIAGMLFDFGRTGPVAMWMKDTWLALDMLFLDAGGRVVFIHRNARPMDRTTIRAPLPVRYVLELPAGAVERFGVRTGDRLEFEPPAGRP